MQSQVYVIVFNSLNKAELQVVHLEPSPEQVKHEALQAIQSSLFIFANSKYPLLHWQELDKFLVVP